MSESDINFKALKKIDPYIKNINLSCSNVALYNFNTHKAEWEKTEVEGTLFLFEREAEPRYGFTIMNRLNPENHIEPVTGQLDFQIQPPFLLYKNRESEIRGLWFYSGEECQKIGNRIQELVKEVEREQEAKKARKAEGAGGGLTALFQKADKALKDEESMKQEKSQKQINHATQNSHADTGKNLLRLLSQPENNNHLNKAPQVQQQQQPLSASTKEETTESVNAFFAMASSNQQLRVTPQPVMNGGLPGAGGVNLPEGGSGLVSLPGGGMAVSTVGGGIIGVPPGMQHHQPVFGMPGVIQALPISQGLAMGAVPIGGFTPLVVTPGTNQNMVFSGPNMPGLINSKPTGAMTVESLEAEQRKSLSPRSQDSENLGDLSSKLKEQLGVKMTTTVQKSVTQLPNIQNCDNNNKNGGPVLMSPLVFSQATGGVATSYTQSADHHRVMAGGQSADLHRVMAGQSAELTEAIHLQQQQQQQQFIELNQQINGTRHVVATKEMQGPREVTPLTQRQMVEAMEFLLKNDEGFVEKLHTAYVQSLQQRLK